MKKTLLGAAAALLIATPVLAQSIDNTQYSSDDPRSTAQWNALVDQANNYRLGIAPNSSDIAIENQGQTAAVKAPTATDAGQAVHGKIVPNTGYFTGGKYNSFQDLWEDR